MWLKTFLIVLNMLLQLQKRSYADAFKTASKKLVQKTAKFTVYLIGKKLADPITVLHEVNQNLCPVNQMIVTSMMIKLKEHHQYKTKINTTGQISKSY